MRELGIIARADDRGDAVVQIAPILISDRATLDAIVTTLEELLIEAHAPSAYDADLLYERRGPVGWITFNRPTARNAMTFAMYDELMRVA